MAIDESAPLLISRPIGHYSAVPLAASDAIVPPAGKVDDENDDTSPPPPLNPQERRASLIKWVCFWMAIAAAIGYLVVESVRRGGGEFEWRSSLSKALGGGLSGAAAMIIQVLSLMPLRTCMNYQYRNGRGFVEVIGLLYAENGVRRFYAGLAPALFQGPLGERMCFPNYFVHSLTSDTTRLSPFRRYCCQRRNIGPSFLESLSESASLSIKDSIRIDRRCAVSNDSCSDRHLEDNTAMRRIESTSDFEGSDTSIWYWDLGESNTFLRDTI